VQAPATLATRLLLASLLLAGCRTPSNRDSGIGGVVEPDTGGAPAEDSGPPARDAAPDVSAPDVGPDDDTAGPPAVRVRIATWNVHRFFDDQCDSGRCEENDWEEVAEPHEFDARAARVASAITALDADVVLLQEVESQRGLDSIVAGLDGEVPTVELGEIGGGGSVDTAILSRWPTVSVQRHRSRVLRRPDGSETKFSREFLEVHLEMEGRRIVVFCAHFRSKLNDDPGRRLAEAQAAAAIVWAAAAAHPTALVLLGGDLNDTPGSAPLEALEEDGELRRVASELTPPADATYVFWGDPVALDHLLLAPTDAAAYVTGSVRVERDASGGFGGSDHAALRADFTIE